MYNNPSIRKQKEIDSILGYFDVNDKFFNPRDILSQYYLNNKPVDLIYKNVKIDIEWKNTFDQNTENIFLRSDLLKLLDLNFINFTGYVKPLKKWYFEALYEL